MSGTHTLALGRRPLVFVVGLAAFVVLPGCGNGKLDGDGGAGEDATSGELTRGSDAPDNDAPVLLEATVRMESDHCFLEASYDDPQGPNDVERGTVWAVEPSTGAVLWTDDLLVCVGYSCVGSYSNSHGEYAAAPCAQLDAFELQALVYDRAGLDSNTKVVEQQ